MRGLGGKRAGGIFIAELSGILPVLASSVTADFGSDMAGF
jgi:hypothetical protein